MTRSHKNYCRQAVQSDLQKAHRRQRREENRLYRGEGTSVAPPTKQALNFVRITDNFYLIHMNKMQLNEAEINRAVKMYKQHLEVSRKYSKRFYEENKQAVAARRVIRRIYQGRIPRIDTLKQCNVDLNALRLAWLSWI